MILYIGRLKKEYDPLAQTVEHLTFNQGVRSSSLRWVTKNIRTFSSDVFLFNSQILHEISAGVHKIAEGVWHYRR